MACWWGPPASAGLGEASLVRADLFVRLVGQVLGPFFFREAAACGVTDLFDLFVRWQDAGPQPRDVVANGGYGGAIGAEGHRPDGVGVAGEGGDRSAGTDVPQSRGPVEAGGGHGGAIGAEHHRVDVA